MGKDEKKPSGGTDKTPLHPQKGPTYTVRITFHRANHLPVADLPRRSSDPFVLAQCNANVPTRHKDDPPIRFRTATAHLTTNPIWDADWVLAGVPASGMELKARVYDEDNGTHDDLLGKVHIRTGPISEGFKILQKKYELTARGANWRAWGLRNCFKPCFAEAREDATITVSFEVVGKTDPEVGKLYTLNNYWFIHFSPLMGKIVGATTTEGEGKENANFQANEIQLTGPVPTELYQRFVNFSMFVKPMFQPKGLQGHLLHAALHRQHEKVYHYDIHTQYGRIKGPGNDLAQRFLDMAQWGEGSRLFTYVMSLDGLFRFTETGAEFGIDLLSKHTMHSDVAVYVAFSGEFFIKKKRQGGMSHPDHHSPQLEDAEHNGQDSHQENGSRHMNDNLAVTEGNTEPVVPDADEDEDPATHQRRHDWQSKLEDDKKWRKKGMDPPGAFETGGETGKPPQTVDIFGPDHGSMDPSQYELVIDNDSGTYRPEGDLLKVLQKYLQGNFGDMTVTTKECTDDDHQAVKKKRREAKQKERGRKGLVYHQDNGSSSSQSSSDEEDDAARASGKPVKSSNEKRFDAISNPKGAAKGLLEKVKGGEKDEKDGSAEAGADDAAVLNEKA